MFAFIVRRIFGMLLVVLAVSFIVYLIFIVIPGGDPASNIAGKVATHANIIAIRHKLGLDRHGFTGLALIGISLPVAWLGLILRYFFAGEGGAVSWFPDGGYVPLTSNPWQWFYHLLLPWFTLAVLFIGFYGRVLRSNILDTINEDFVRTAKARGLSTRQILVKHVLRASLIPIVTLFGLDFASVLGGGAIITETVYNLHGVGWYAAQSIASEDPPPLEG